MTLSGATFTGLETGILVGATGLVNFALCGLAWEVGVGVGSLISAAPLGADMTVGNIFGYYLYDMINDRNSFDGPCE